MKIAILRGKSMHGKRSFTSRQVPIRWRYKVTKYAKSSNSRKSADKSVCEKEAMEGRHAVRTVKRSLVDACILSDKLPRQAGPKNGFLESRTRKIKSESVSDYM